MPQTKKSKKSVKSRHMVLSSNVSIYPLFSRGCLFPPEIELFDDYAFPKPHASKFVVFRDKIPASLIDDYAKVARNIAPIAIELQKVSRTNKKSSDDLALTQNSIPLKQVKRIIFRSEDDLKFFKASEFTDVKVSSINMEMTVEEEIFKDVGKTASLFESVQDEKVDIEKVRKIVRQSDSYAGFLCALLYSTPADEKWFKAFVDRLNNKPVKELEIEFDRFQAILQVILSENNWESQNSENTILNIASKTIFQIDSKMGWPAKELLKSLTDELNQKFNIPSMKKEAEDIKMWSELTRNILDDKKPLTQLTDDKSIALRSILLLLIRENCLSLLNLKENDSTTVGENVWRCALMMTSIREGLRTLPTELKSAPTQIETRMLMEFLGDVIATHSEQLIEGDSSLKKIDLKFEKLVENGSQALALTYKGSRILTRQVESNQFILKIKEFCINYGFSVDSVGQDSIQISSGKSKLLKSKVCVSIIAISDCGKCLVRFEIDVVAINTNSRAKQSDPFTALNKKFSKKELIELLGSNSSTQLGSVAIKFDPLVISVNFDLIAENLDNVDTIEIINRLSERAAKISEVQKKTKK